MTNRVLKAGVHDLVRVDGAMSTRIGRAEMEITPAVEGVIDQLSRLYVKRNRKAFGRFSGDLLAYPTAGFVSDYLDRKGEFSTLSRRLMAFLEVKAAAKARAGEGHVFFAHVEDGDGSFLLVAVLTEKLARALTADWEVQESMELDLDGFRFAGRIGIDGWRRADGHYISFLKGKGDIADYFREFLGCDEKERSKADTLDFVEAVTSFVDAAGMPAAERSAFMKDAREICAKAAREQTGLDFSAFANQLLPKGPEPLLDVLTHPDRGLADDFVPDLGTLGALVTFKASTDLWSLSFHRDAFASGDIDYDPKRRMVLVKKLPAELKRRLDQEFASRG